MPIAAKKCVMKTVSSVFNKSANVLALRGFSFALQLNPKLLLLFLLSFMENR